MKDFKLIIFFMIVVLICILSHDLFLSLGILSGLIIMVVLDYKDQNKKKNDDKK